MTIEELRADHRRWLLGHAARVCEELIQISMDQSAVNHAVYRASVAMLDALTTALAEREAVALLDPCDSEGGTV